MGNIGLPISFVELICLTKWRKYGEIDNFQQMDENLRLAMREVWHRKQENKTEKSSYKLESTDILM